MGVNDPAALALRALQKYDAVTFGETIEHRHMLLEAQTHLGGLLGLTCTGKPEGGGYYDHSGDTCPVHEWLVPTDYYDVAAEPRSWLRRTA